MITANPAANQQWPVSRKDLALVSKRKGIAIVVVGTVTKVKVGS